MSRGPRNGGRILVDQLVVHGADLVFGVPGESYLAALDAMHDVNSLRYINCRQEGGAAMMAEAHGKLTGRPGICFVTRGPGATNASAGVHIADQDSTPMILLIGQIARETREREAFQEVDYRQFFGGMAKWVAEIEDAARIPEFMHRAFVTATSGRPGPVVLALPEDMLTDIADVEDGRPYQTAEAAPSPAAMAQLRAMLEKAERPLVIVGGGGWNEAGLADLVRFVEANELPVAAAFRRQDYVDNLHPNYAGHVGIAPDPKLAARVTGSDCLIVIGARMGEMTTGGYTLLGLPRPTQPLIHIHNDGTELGRVYQADLPIQASLPAAAAALAAMPPVTRRPWAADTKAAHADYLAHIQPIPHPGDLQMGEVMAFLRERLPADTIVTNGAGNYCTWPNRFYSYRAGKTQLAPTSGSMGYGLPAAVGAKIAMPDRPVVCFAGDGCFQMHGQELGTAAQSRAPIMVLLVNNGMYGTIRMHQEREFPGRTYGTDLGSPDFVKLAEAYGAHGARVTRTEDFAEAFEAGWKAMEDGRSALIELVIDPEAITPTRTLSQIRETSLKG